MCVCVGCVCMFVCEYVSTHMHACRLTCVRALRGVPGKGTVADARCEFGTVADAAGKNKGEVGCHGRPCPPAPLRAAGRSPGGAAHGAAAGYLCVEWASVSRAAGGGGTDPGEGECARTTHVTGPQSVEVPWVLFTTHPCESSAPHPPPQGPTRPRTAPLPLLV